MSGWIEEIVFLVFVCFIGLLMPALIFFRGRL